jgi:DAK2 domain fusion protein YloV
MELGPDSVKKPFNQKRFTSVLLSRGNSLVVVRDDNIVKVHVHTLNPGTVLNYAQQFGEFLKLKIENMTEQHHALASGAQVEEHTDLVPEPEKEQPHQPFALIAVSSGDGIDEFFNEIGVTELVKGGQTMNPSSEDFLAAIKHANADNIFIFPNNSNIVMAATQAAEMCENDNVYVVPSKTILQGLSAAMMFNPEASNEDNLEEMKAALKNVTSGEVTFSIRDTEINGLSIKKDEFIGIMNKDIVVNGTDKKEVLFSLLSKMITDESSLITLLCGEDVDDSLMEEVQAYIEEHYSDLDVDVRKGNQPVYSFLVGVE